MDKEAIGMVLGWAVITVTAWFVALALLAYVGWNGLPWTWSSQERAAHLGLQVLLIAGFAAWKYPNAN